MYLCKLTCVLLLPMTLSTGPDCKEGSPGFWPSEWEILSSSRNMINSMDIGVYSSAELFYI